MSSEPNRRGPYSANLRWKVVYQRLGQSLSLNRIVHNFSLSIETVHNILEHFTTTGEIDAKAQGTRLGSRKLSASEEMFVVGLVLDRPFIYLQEICDDVLSQIGVVVSVPNICRLLKRLVRRFNRSLFKGIHSIVLNI